MLERLSRVMEEGKKRDLRLLVVVVAFSHGQAVAFFFFFALIGTMVLV